MGVTLAQLLTAAATLTQKQHHLKNIAATAAAPYATTDHQRHSAQLDTVTTAFTAAAISYIFC
jgi:hypothetical protein